MASQVTTHRIMRNPQCRSRARCSSASSSSNGRPTNEIGVSSSVSSDLPSFVAVYCEWRWFASSCTPSFPFTSETSACPSTQLCFATNVEGDGDDDSDVDGCGGRKEVPPTCEGCETGCFGNLPDPDRLTPRRSQARWVPSSRRKASLGSMRSLDECRSLELAEGCFCSGVAVAACCEGEGED